MSAITRSENGALAMPEAEMMKVLQSSLYPGASPDSIKMVLGYCKAAGLDPMQKPVHIVPMWDSKAKCMRDVIMPGIGLYRTQAARSGCAGVTEPEFGPDISENIGGTAMTYPAWCRVTVRRRIATGEVVEFTAKEFWKENYATAGKDSSAPNAMWKKRPYGQIAKCAEAQALRKAFPEIGSEPTADEMMGKTINEFAEEARSTLQATPPPRQALELYPAERFEANLPKWEELVATGQKTNAEIEAMLSTKATLTEEQREAIRNLGTVREVSGAMTEEGTAE
jgi:phage recombination protein Bet